MATGFTVPSLSNITQNLAMRAYGMNPSMAGISQDPSKLEYGEIKGAGLASSPYAETSQYGLMEDLYESPIGQISPALSTGIATLAPAITAAASPIYDLGQAAYRAYQDPNLGILQAIKNENIPQMWKGRTLGATKFLADKLGLGNLFGQPKFRKEMVKKVSPTSQAVQVAQAESTSGGGGGSSQQEKKERPRRQQGTQKQEQKRQQRTRSRGAQRGQKRTKRAQRTRSRGAQRRSSRPSRSSSYSNVRRYGRADGGIVSLDYLTRSL